MCRARPRRPRGGDRVLQGAARSTSSWSGRKRRWPPASSMISSAPASRRSDRRKRRRGSKARRVSPRICARRTTFRPPPIERFTAAARGQGLCARARRADRGQGRRARRRQGRHRRADASRRPRAAIDMMFGGGFGEAGAEVVIEEFLAGEEASFFVLSDGEHCVAARERAGPQARVRRRPRAEHRRHGRLFAGAGDDAGDDRARAGRNRRCRPSAPCARWAARIRACSMPG